MTAALLLAGAPAPSATVTSPTIVEPITTPIQAPVPMPAPAAPLPASTPALQLVAGTDAPPSLPGAAATEAEPSDQNAITVTARRHDPGDPLEAINTKSFEVTQAVDRALVRPLAKTYQRILPDPVRSGFRNVLNNLREPVAFLNFLLQFKPGKALETAARFVVNSSIGVVGLFDIAKRRPFHLPRRINGFAYTLGYYGVKSGPFLFLPLIGPTTLRDFIGDGLDRLFLPVVVGRPFSKPVYATAVGAFSSLDQRAEFDEKLEVLHEGSADPYAATRTDYLKHRQDIIDGLHNRPVTPATPEASGIPAPQAVPAPSAVPIPAPAPVLAPNTPPATPAIAQ